MDGMKLGILGVLIDFIRLQSYVNSLSRIANKQYNMREPKFGAFSDVLFLCSK